MCFRCVFYGEGYPLYLKKKDAVTESEKESEKESEQEPEQEPEKESEPKKNKNDPCYCEISKIKHIVDSLLRKNGDKKYRDGCSSNFSAICKERHCFEKGCEHKSRKMVDGVYMYCLDSYGCYATIMKY